MSYLRVLDKTFYDFKYDPALEACLTERTQKTASKKTFLESHTLTCTIVGKSWYVQTTFYSFTLRLQTCIKKIPIYRFSVHQINVIKIVTLKWSISKCDELVLNVWSRSLLGDHNCISISFACLYITLEVEADCESWGWFWRIIEKNLHVFRYISKSYLWIYINVSLLEGYSAPPSRVKFMRLAEVIFGVYGSVYHFSKPVHISTILCEKIFIYSQIIVSIDT